MRAGGSTPTPRLLLDTNIVIAVEPYAGQLEQGLTLAARLVRLASEQGCLLCVAPATRDDLLEAGDPRLRAQRLAELEKFSVLQEVPVSSQLVALAGESIIGSNGHRDLRILAALEAGAATHLVTEDGPLRRRAARAGLGEATLSLADAVAMLQSFEPQIAPPPPRVTEVASYALDIDQSIFQSLREGYEDFDSWLNKVRQDSSNRRCFVIRDYQTDEYAAIVILKNESEGAYDFTPPVIKICTFKVSPEFSGVKYGELLLKAIFNYAQMVGAATLYVEVFETQDVLISFLGDFGFHKTDFRTGRVEAVLRKRLGPVDKSELTDLDYHVEYGPPALLARQSMYVIPIEPRWHDQLFPELKPGGEFLQEPLFTVDTEPPTHPWGNALRKAYLSNGNINRIVPGDLVLFYRSHDQQSVAVVGIVEDTLRSADPVRVMRFVGRRTVYTPEEIARMCRSVRGVLAIRFRQDRFVDPPWPLDLLQSSQVVTSWPQTVSSIRREGQEWVRAQLIE